MAWARGESRSWNTLRVIATSLPRILTPNPDCSNRHPSIRQPVEARTAGRSPMCRNTRPRNVTQRLPLRSWSSSSPAQVCGANPLSAPVTITVPGCSASNTMGASRVPWPVTRTSSA
jgi:hypothetical protein